ncbi:MAG TPA: MucB/RseB C-terminal domain-containing protein [Pararobbsia sp.]|nr:MucB/RseB C-terminal domain-containing protein [Pararobbsia sp.]
MQPAASRADANAWLAHIDRAARQETYEGTFIYQRGGSFQSSKIIHYLDHGNELERVEGLDGRPTRTLRKNDDVYTFVPDRKLVIVDRRSNKYTFPALLAGGPTQLLDVYDVRLIGDDRVAGFDAQVIELDPKDAYRFAFRLWFDKKTGLLLRAQTLDDKKQVLEQIAFSQLTFNVPYDHRTVATGIRDTSGWNVVHPPTDTVDMAAEGWQVPPTVAGFHEMRELRRPMAAREQGAPPVQVDQAVYSDGLSAVSVFVEPVGKSDRKEGIASSGATHILVRKSGDFWITVVGEVPQPTLEQFASALTYKAPK